jgi:hypothetical protein
MEFQGKLYNITDSKGNLVKNLSKGHGQVLREVFASY